MDQSNPQLDKHRRNSWIRSFSQYPPALLSSQCLFSCFKATLFEVKYIYHVSWDLNLKQRHDSDKAQSQWNIADLIWRWKNTWSQRSQLSVKTQHGAFPLGQQFLSMRQFYNVIPCILWRKKNSNPRLQKITLILGRSNLNICKMASRIPYGVGGSILLMGVKNLEVA